MKKFILNQNGEEVKVGDILIKYEPMDTVLGKLHIAKKIVVNEAILAELVEAGVIKVFNEEGLKPTSNIPMELNFYIDKVANKLGFKQEVAHEFLNKSYSVSPVSVFSMIIREIAIELDKKYEDHINNSPDIYVISMTDGRITKANKAHIKNYRNFAAFRSIEDARIACRIVKPLLKGMFKSGGK